MKMLNIKKIWLLIKHYWYIPVVGVGIIVMLVLTRKRPDGLINVLKNATETHKKEVAIIQEVHDEEIAKREMATNTFHETVKKVEERYKEEQQQLSKQKKKAVQKLVEKNKEDPEALAKELAELTGFDFVRTETKNE